MSPILDSLSRGARLRCPCCGYGRLFRSAFTMYDRCLACDETFDPEPGLWFGAIYINLALTLAFTVFGIVVTGWLTTLTPVEQLSVWTPMAAAGPFVFFRFAKGLWISLVFLGDGRYLAWPNR